MATENIPLRTPVNSKEDEVPTRSGRTKSIMKALTPKVKEETVVNLLNKKKKKSEDGQNFCTFDESPKSLFGYVKNNQVARLERVYARAPDRFLIRNDRGETLLHAAAAEGHLNVVHFLLDCPEINIDELDSLHQNTALHFAVLHSQLTVIDYLILKGARVDVLNCRYLAPIHVATEKNLIDSLKELLKHRNVDPNLPGENDAPPIHNAAANNFVECTRILLEAGACPCKANASGLHSVHIAAKGGSKEVLEILVQDAAKRGYDRKHILNCPDRDGNVPLHAAVDSGNLEAVRICLEVGADIDVQQEDKSTPIHFACTRNELEMLKLMFAMQPDKKRFTLALRDANGMTPLHRAALLDNHKVIEYLLDQGADTELSDLNGRTPLLVAASSSAGRSISLLIKRGANMFHHDGEGRNFIHLAVINRTSLDDLKVGMDSAFGEKMRILLNERDSNGSTPLHYASGDGRLQAIERLLLDGAEVTIRNNDRDTALHFAARHGRYNSCRRLLESPHGPFIINVQDWNGCSAMFVAAQNGHTRVVDLFLLKGALYHRNHAGETVLHAAARGGHTQTARLLINNNPGLINAVAVCGNTALHIAAASGHKDVVILLMDNGAEVTLNRSGKSFLHEAVLNKHENVVIAILKHDRWRESMMVYSKMFTCPTRYLIELMPHACVILLDNCTKPNEKPPNNFNYAVEYDFHFIEPGIDQIKQLTEDVGDEYVPLPALNLMVQHGHLELLSHPCSQAVLKMKWDSYGRTVFVLRLVWWMVYVFLITYYTVMSNPLCHAPSIMMAECQSGLADYEVMTVASSHGNNTKASVTSDAKVNASDPNCALRVKAMHDVCIFETSIGRLLSQYMLFCMNLFSFLLNSIVFLKRRVFMVGEFPVIGICRYAMLNLTLIFIAPTVFSGDNYIATHWQWNVGFLAMFASWIHLFLFLQLDNTVGIYVVMFMEILKTLLKASLIFVILLCGFGFTFHVLLKYDLFADPHFQNPRTSLLSAKTKHSTTTPGVVALSAFKTPLLSVFKVLLMMTGELDFLDTFAVPLEDENDETLHFPVMTYVILFLFIVCVPIVVMNLLLGLALGNIEVVLRNANLKKICMQVQLLSDIEKNIPFKVLACFKQKRAYVDYPNHILSARSVFCLAYARILRLFGKSPHRKSYSILSSSVVNVMKSTAVGHNGRRVTTEDTNASEHETKFTNKEICVLLERQTEMLRSVMQHLQIGSADLEELEDDQLACYLNTRESKRSKGDFRTTAMQVKKSAAVLKSWNGKTMVRSSTAFNISTSTDSNKTRPCV